VTLPAARRGNPLPDTATAHGLVVAEEAASE
jgi:hypothetical protein